MTVLKNAAQVLRCFGSGVSELTVTDVTGMLDMPKANASRLMKAMREAGLLETIGTSKRHRPGRMLLDIAATIRASSRLIREAGEVVARISRESGHTGYVSVLDGAMVRAALDFEGTNALRVVSSSGRSLHAHASATGRTLLARLSGAEIRALYPDGALPQQSERAPGGIEALLREIERVRGDGYAISFEESTPGVDALAVAVADPAADEAVSLCVVFPAAVVAAADRDAILQALREGAARIAGLTGDMDFLAPAGMETEVL